MLTFIAVSEYHTESQKQSEYTQKLYNNIWFHRGSEHIPYYNLQKSTLQKFKILNIKKYNCRNRCRNWNQKLLRMEVGETTRWRHDTKQSGSPQTVLTAGFGTYDRRTKRELNPKELRDLKWSYKWWQTDASRRFHLTGDSSTGSML